MIEAVYDACVTANLKDFPEDVLGRYRVEALSPDAFVLRVIEYDLEGFIDTVANHRSILERPAQTVDEYLHTLFRQGLIKTVAFLERYRSEI